MYKRIITLFAITTLVFAAKSQAQLYVGVEAGANRNYFVTNADDKPFFEYQPLYGYSAGATVRYAIPSMPWFGGIQATPSYVQKNYRIQRTGFYEPIYQDNTNSYVELPIMAQFRFGGMISRTQSLHGFLNLGGYGGYWLSGNIKGRTLSPMDPTNFQAYNEAYTFSNEKDNRIEWGGLAGIGLQYMPNKNYAISLEGRYTAAATDQQKAYMENQTPRYNDTYSILMRVEYQLPFSKSKVKTSK